MSYYIHNGIPYDFNPGIADARKVTKKEYETTVKDRARADLRKTFPPGSTAYTILSRVSRSGMSRHIRIVDGHSNDVTWLVARALGETFQQSTGGIRVDGCGMDMGFHLVYRMSRALYRDGFGIAGELKDARRVSGIRKVRAKTARAAANLEARGAQFRGRNGDTSGWDNDGGYAIRHRWL